MANYVFSPWRPIAWKKKDGALKAHRAGWSYLWAQQLDAEIVENRDIPDDCTHLYIELGMEFETEKGSFNQVCSGGMWDNLYVWFDRWISYLEKGGKCTILDWDSDGYLFRGWAERMWARYDGHQNQLRRLAAGDTSIPPCSPKFSTLFPDRVQILAHTCREGALHQKDLDPEKFPSLSLGDSHSLATWFEGAKASRNDGQTLHGALKRGLKSYLVEMNMQKGMPKLRTYFGNIDLRHHICRLYQTPALQKQAITSMIEEYVSQLRQLKDEYSIEKIEVVETLPIEMDGRRIPGTGKYPPNKKGQNFWGTWEERTHAHKFFNAELKRFQEQDPFFEVITWPTWFAHDEDVPVMSNDAKAVESDIKKQNPPVQLIHPKGSLRYEVMEDRGSVHLFPEHYKWAHLFSTWTEREKYYGQK